MSQIFLIIMMLVIGFLAGIAISCSTLIFKIEKITHTKNIHDALEETRNLSTQLNSISNEVTRLSQRANNKTNRN